MLKRLPIFRIVRPSANVTHHGIASPKRISETDRMTLRRSSPRVKQCGYFTSKNRSNFCFRAARVSVTSSFDSAVFVDCWVVGQFDRFRCSGIRHACDATYESYDDLSADQKSQSRLVATRAYETRKHREVSRYRGRRCAGDRRANRGVDSPSWLATAIVSDGR